MSGQDSHLYRVLDAITDQPHKSGRGWAAKCPAHDDRHASLSIGVGDDGRVLLNCHAGCDTREILSAAGLSFSDLYPKLLEAGVLRHWVARFTYHVRRESANGKSMHWEHNGKLGLNGRAAESLPLYRVHDLDDATGPVVVVEGEKAADALASLGVLAVGTVTGASGTPLKEVFAPLRGREVWLWPDNDELGRQHMARIALQLDSEPMLVKWALAPPKGDAADYVAAGGTAEGIRSMLERSNSRLGVRIGDAAVLLTTVLPEPRWAVPGIFPEGVVLLVGKSKLGKSWFALDVAKAVATGAKAWGGFQVEQGEVFYLALEDSERRLSDRLTQIYGSEIKPATFMYAVKFPRANEGGLDLVLEWLNDHPRARLVVIDVLGKFRPREANARRLYDMDYDAIAPIAELARQRGVCVLVLHHANKIKWDDPIDSVSGTTGLAGAADVICVFRRERGKADASLLITGRDVEERELAFKFILAEQRDHAWELMGDAAELRMSAERQEIIDVIGAQPGVTPSEISAAVGRPSGNVRHMLFKMVHNGQIRVTDSHYFPSLALPPSKTLSTTPGNTVHKGADYVANEFENDVKRVTQSVTHPSRLGNVSDVASDHNIAYVNSVSAYAQSKIKGVTRQAGKGLSDAPCRKCGRPLALHSKTPELCWPWE